MQGVLRLFCLCWLVGVLPVRAESSAMPGPALRSAENRWFEIVALDVRSIGYMEMLSRQVVEGSFAYLDGRRMDFPQRILVQLRPPAYVDFEGPYRVRIGEGGFISLDLRWANALDLETCCRALSEALILRYVYFNFGPGGVDRVPRWTIAALGSEVFFTLRPALFPADVGDFGAWPLAEVISRKWTAREPEDGGDLLIRALAQSGVSAAMIRSIYQRALVGEALEPHLAEALDLAPEGLEAWWQSARGDAGKVSSTAFEHLGDSREWIQALSDFEMEGERVNLRQLWDRRGESAVRDLVSARLEILRIRILRVNPAYFNAARSLGVLFETILESERPHEYIGSLSKYLGDLENAREIERITGEALSKQE